MVSARTLILHWFRPAWKSHMSPLVRFSINPSIRVLVFTGCILVLAAEVRYGNVIRFDLPSLGTMPTGSLSLTTSFKTDVSIAGLFDEAFLQEHGKLGLWFEVIDREQGMPFLTFLRKTGGFLWAHHTYML